ncbi:MAG: DUF58 domain-containing protein [Ginsengibacter sp.]
MYIISFFAPFLLVFAPIALTCILILTLADYTILFLGKTQAYAQRILPERLSNGDENSITIRIKNHMPYTLHVDVIDELPEQLQVRDLKKSGLFKAGEEKLFFYTIRPLQRGEYFFGNLLLFVSTNLGLVQRKIAQSAEVMSPVYPSFLQLRKYQLLSQATIQTEAGTKRMRKMGHSMAFEQIKDYVTGDDIRTLNWKASARKGGLMINTFSDERSQQVYCIIDKGRLMKMPFSGLTLLDHAINSCLVISNVCLNKQDKVGLITFSNKMGTMLAAEKKATQKSTILEVLYNQKTDFLESDFEKLYTQVRSRIKQRSLLILYTNFESLSGLKRQLDYLRSLASHHLLLVVFFENIELKVLTNQNAGNLEDVYIKTIAQKFAFEKKLIVKELMKYGILTLLTTPQRLTIDSLNKYLELKARQAL